MKNEKSFDVGLKLEGKNIEEYSILPKIEVNEIIEEEWQGDQFHYSLPIDKHGVYVVYENDTCLYVGETKNKKGFKKRFEGHHYLKEFRSKATKIILYVIDKEKHNDRVLFEKLKIKELNPILNRAENREDSIRYSLNVIEEIKQNVNELTDIFGEDTNVNPEEIEGQVVKSIRQVQEILNQIDPKRFVFGDESEYVNESGLNSQLNYKSLKIIDCMMCNGEKDCGICCGSGKLIGEKICNDCDGIGFKNDSSDVGYCKTCKGNCFSIFTVFEERAHTKFFLDSCEVCDNTGEDVSGEPCEECRGKRYILVKELDME